MFTSGLESRSDCFDLDSFSSLVSYVTSTEFLTIFGLKFSFDEIIVFERLVGGYIFWDLSTDLLLLPSVGSSFLLPAKTNYSRASSLATLKAASLFSFIIPCLSRTCAAYSSCALVFTTYFLENFRYLALVGVPFFFLISSF